VSFQSIRKDKFDRFRSPHLGLESLMPWQIEWFANKTGTIIGTLAVDKVDEGWNYIVLGRDERGDFRVLKLGGDAFSLDDARTELLFEMAAAEKSRRGSPDRKGCTSAEDGSAVREPRSRTASQGRARGVVQKIASM